jgi:hypothetical protein
MRPEARLSSDPAAGLFELFEGSVMGDEQNLVEAQLLHPLKPDMRRAFYAIVGPKAVSANQGRA